MHEGKVNLAFPDTAQRNFVSVSGTAGVVRNAEKIEQLWSEDQKLWFPQGKRDPELALLCVQTEKAEYWDAPGGPVQRLRAYAKTRATGDSRHLGGEHEKLTTAAR